MIGTMKTKMTTMTKRKMRIGEMLRVTKKNLVSVIYYPTDKGCRAYVKDAHSDRYYYREYRNSLPQCVLSMIQTPAVRSITLNGKVISQLHGSTAPFEPVLWDENMYEL